MKASKIKRKIWCYLNNALWKKQYWMHRILKKRDQFKTGCMTAAGLLEGNALKNELVC